ncbi:MAG: hypothetical protein RL563_2700 [Pseudomonadota bacterium]
MATAREYAQWIVDNEDKAGTPDFNTVAQAYQRAKQLESQAASRPPAPPEGILSSFGRGLASYGPQLQETFGGLQALTGKALAETIAPQAGASLIKSGVERMQEAEKKTQAATRPGEASFTEALDKGVGTVLTEWLPYQIGSGAANLLETLGVMGAGALVGSAAPGIGTAAGAITGAVEKELVKKKVRDAAKEIALKSGEEASKKFVEKETLAVTKEIARKYGMGAALAGQAAGYGFGQTASRAVESAIERGERPEDIDLARVIPAGMVSTAAEFVSDKLAFGALKGLKKEVKDAVEDTTRTVLRRAIGTAGDMGKGVLITGTKEAPTEIIQSLAERFGAKLSLSDKQAIDEYINAVAASYAMSVVPGAIGGIKTKPVEEEKAVEAAAEKPLALEYKPDTLVVFPDGSVGKRGDVENYINSLPEDQRIQARARLLGMGEKPATPIKEGAPLTEDEIFQLDQQLMVGAPRPRAEDMLGQVRGAIQTAPATTPEDVARIRDEHETAVINSLLEQDRKMQTVSDLARLNVERASQTESMEAATQDADRRVREGRLMGRVQSLIDQNIPFASTAIADINRKFEMIGEAPLDDAERARVQNIMTMAQGFTDFVKLPSPPVREQDIFAENQAMEALIKERKPRGQVPAQPVRAEASAPSQGFQEAPISTGIEEGRAVRPEGGIEPGVTENRQRVESIAPAQRAPAVSPAPTPVKSLQGSKTRIITPDGNKIPAEWKVVEADSIAASMVEGKSQPRDRQRAASNAQVAEIAQNPDFDRLSDTSQTMDYGAPTLTQDDLIVGGNGRFEGVSRSYDSEAGQRYKQSLLENSARLGLDPEQIGAMKKPILVRKITQAADTRKLAIQSNIVAGLKLSDMEQAALDVERMGGLDRLAISDTGDIPLTAGNIEAIRDSLRDYTTEEIADMMSADGGLSQTGLRRVKNAILYKAYGKTDTLARLIESPDPDLKNIGTALMRASGNMSRMMDAIRSGAIPAEYNIIEELTGAIETLSSLRASGTKLEEFLGQSELFGDGISGSARSILKFMDSNLRSAKSITEYLNNYAQVVLSAESATSGLFGEVKLPTKQETLERAAEKYEAQRKAAKSQQSIFEQPAGEVREEGRAKPEGAGRAAGSDEKAREIEKKQAEDSGAPKTVTEDMEEHAFIKQMGAETFFETKVKEGKAYIKSGVRQVPNKALSKAIAEENTEAVFDQIKKSANPIIANIGKLAESSKLLAVGMMPDNVKRGFKKAFGVYIPDHGAIYFRNKEAASSESVVAHEIAHALTHAAIDYPTDQQKPAVKRLENLFSYVKQKLGKEGSSLYGLTNLHEFVAEANSNVYFQYKLRQIKYQNQTAWGAFTKYVAQILGIGNDTALSEVIALTEELARPESRKVVSKPGQVFEMREPEEAAGKVEKIARKIEAKVAPPKERIEVESFKHIKDPALMAEIQRRFNPKPETIVDRINSMRENFWEGMAQGFMDKYRAIKKYSDEGYMLARMSNTVDGAVEGLLFHGQVFNDGGALNIKPKTEGLYEAFRPLGKELDNFLIWMAMSRDANLPEEKRSFSAAALAAKDELIDGSVGGRPRKEVYNEVRRKMNALNKSVLDVAKDAGIIDQEGYDRFSSDLYYVPMYKVTDQGELVPVSGEKLTDQFFSKELKGNKDLAFGDLMQNIVQNWSHILSASMKNIAATKVVKDAERFDAVRPSMKAQYEYENGVVYKVSKEGREEVGELRPEYTTKKTGTVSVIKDGMPVYYEVGDPLLLDSIAGITWLGPQGKWLDVAKNFKNMLQFGVTISPAFRVRNLIRDAVSAISVADIKKNPVMNAIEGMNFYDPKDPNYIGALAGGGMMKFGAAMEGGMSENIKRLVKAGVPDDTILDSPEKIKNGLKFLYNKYEEWGNKMENANRLAIYQQARAKGMSHLEASFHAKDLMDFTLHGSFPAFRRLTMVIPFLNARVQGLYKLGRDGITPTYRLIYSSLTGKEISESDKKKGERFAIVASAVGLASAALYLAFKDDEEFKKREQWDRDNFWWIKFPGMEHAFRIPKPFELGAFGTLVERSLEQIVDKGAEGKVFGEAMGRMLSDTFAINPIPQMFKPMLDIYANKDSFTGAPIETAGMEKLSKQERVADNTSWIGKGLGGVSKAIAAVTTEKAELSPVQIEYLIKGYFGWLGAMATSTAHYAVMPFSQGAYPDMKYADTFSMGFVKDLPATQSKFVTSFYDNNEKIQQAMADMRHYAALGEVEKAQKIAIEQSDKIMLAKFYNKASDDMAKMRKQISIITADTKMTGAEKREQIDRAKLIIAEIARQAEELRVAMKK